MLRRYRSFTWSHSDELELHVLWQLWQRLGHSENGADNVHSGVALLPQAVEAVHGQSDVALVAGQQHVLDDGGMGLVADLEHGVSGHKAEAGPGRLEVVDRLAHVTFRCEEERFQTFIVVFDRLSLADFHQTLEQFGVA